MSASVCFEYGGYHFFPLRHFAKGEGDFFALSKHLESDPSVGLSEYKERQKFPYSYDDFYKAATNPNYDIFCCVENGKSYVPATRELFVYHNPSEYSKREARVIQNRMLIDTKNQQFDMQRIDNRRFMFNPKTGVLLLGVQYKPSKKIYGSHAEDLANARIYCGFDDYVRGWVGTGKGNNAFVICTHIDKHHIHNHIIINSVNLDCTRKFRNFWNSSFAIRRINDKLCLEHGLLIVENPKPSKGHYGTWLGDDQKISYQEQLRRIIDTVLEEKPTGFSDFLEKLKSCGVTVNTDRKNLRLKVPGQTKFTRCNTLKGDYTEQAIRERIDGKRTVTPKRGERKPQPKVGLLIDIDAAIRSGKGAGYERWAKVFNLKQLSQAVLYLKEHGDMTYEELQERTAAAVTRFNELSAEIKDLESQMSANGELQKQIVSYAKTRAVYTEYRKAGYSKKFRAAHEAEILIHQAAKKYFDSLNADKLPNVKALREEYAALLAQKRRAYAEYKRAREEMKELYNVKSNVEHLLNIDEREIERDREKEQR